jgi:hypothetical protein
VAADGTAAVGLQQQLSITSVDAIPVLPPCQPDCQFVCVGYPESMADVQQAVDEKGVRCVGTDMVSAFAGFAASNSTANSSECLGIDFNV